MSEPRWLLEARKMLGVKEGPGPVDNPVVLKLYEEAGCGHVAHDSTAWCAAFVGAMLRRANFQGTHSLAARSYEDWGTNVSYPVMGAITTLHRGDPRDWQGHVGFLVAANDRTVWLLGGNQNDQVSIAPFNRKRVTAMRWPAMVDFSLEPVPTHGPMPAEVKVT